jgi:hypothetical protein
VHEVRETNSLPRLLCEEGKMYMPSGQCSSNASLKERRLSEGVNVRCAHEPVRECECERVFFVFVYVCVRVCVCVCVRE